MRANSSETIACKPDDCAVDVVPLLFVGASLPALVVVSFDAVDTCVGGVAASVIFLTIFYVWLSLPLLFLRVVQVYLCVCVFVSLFSRLDMFNKTHRKVT